MLAAIDAIRCEALFGSSRPTRWPTEPAVHGWLVDGELMTHIDNSVAGAAAAAAYLSEFVRVRNRPCCAAARVGQ